MVTYGEALKHNMQGLVRVMIGQDANNDAPLYPALIATKQAVGEQVKGAFRMVAHEKNVAAA